MKTRSKKIKRDKNYVSKNKVETSEEQKEDKPKPKEEKPKPKEEKPRSVTKKSPELLKKHGYNITNRSVDRHQSLGKLVILYGVSDLIKKIDSISVENPNLLDKYNEDKRWIKNNFKSRRSVRKS